MSEHDENLIATGALAPSIPAARWAGPVQDLAARSHTSRFGLAAKRQAPLPVRMAG